MTLFFDKTVEGVYNETLCKEYINDICQHQIKLFQIDVEATNVHPLYEESKRKNWHTPVDIYCLVLHEPVEQVTDRFSTENKYKITIGFQKSYLDTLNLPHYPACGDYFQWGGYYWEMAEEEADSKYLNTGDPDLSEFVICIAINARESDFAAK